MRREFSAGGVLVRRLRGRWHVAAIRPGGKPAGTWALPKGLIDAGEDPAATALREVEEETGARGRLDRKLGDVRYVYTWDRRTGLQGRQLLPRPVLRRPARRDRAGVRGTRSPRCAGCRSTRHHACSPTAANATWRGVRRNPRLIGVRMAAGRPAPMIGRVEALNFYSPIVESQLRSGRKTATIRLGDKSAKYRKGMIVAVLAGPRFSPRTKIFDAVIDKVEVKRSATSPRTRSSTTTPRSAASRTWRDSSARSTTVRCPRRISSR